MCFIEITPITHSSTAKQEEKQEERGSCKTLVAKYNCVTLNGKMIIGIDGVS